MLKCNTPYVIEVIIEAYLLYKGHDLVTMDIYSEATSDAAIKKLEDYGITLNRVTTEINEGSTITYYYSLKIEFNDDELSKDNIDNNNTNDEVENTQTGSFISYNELMILSAIGIGLFIVTRKKLLIR